MDDLEELENWTSMDSFLSFLGTQKDLFHSQIEQLQQIVAVQCKLTGVNPLSQEMAAGALSIKIGKKPRDLLNPKAVNYMQAVFSVKDVINKKEFREISAQFGISVTQVRDFFNGQRTRLRKLLRLSSEKACRVGLPNALKFEGCESSSSSHVHARIAVPIAHDALPSDSFPLINLPAKYSDEIPSHFNLAGHTFLSKMDPEPLSMNPPAAELLPMSSVEPVKGEESSSLQNEKLVGLDEFDHHFIRDVFAFLRREETFAGQVKLLEWILQIQNPSVLNWFLAEGGALVLTSWLGVATSEEQTSVIFVILKVFCHLPLQNCLPEHMSAVLQSVNKLRYYRTSDISNRARVLLSKWSKLFSRTQALKKANGSKPFTSAQEMLLKQSIEEVMGDEMLQSFERDSCHMLPLPSDNPEAAKKAEAPQVVKLLAAPSDEASKKHVLGISASNSKKRRKVQLVDQHGQTSSSKNVQSSKLVASVSRPMSADDIQKAKMRALYKQSKLGKNLVSVDGSMALSPEVCNKPGVSPISKRLIRSVEEQIVDHAKRTDHMSNQNGVPPKVDSKELLRLCLKAQIQWRTPPEVVLNDAWRVGGGESCKELDVQKNRNRREMEIFYCAIHDIPSNPREPWDTEMDYDDTLTPEIPIEQPPDADSEEQISSADTAIAAPQASSRNASEPDLELLAALLKNPELVFALTSAQGGSLSNDDTVRLLDMIKTGGDLNGGIVETKAEVSLPSPTPSSNPAATDWRSEAAGNPFSRAAVVPEKLPPKLQFHPSIVATERQSHQQIPTRLDFLPAKKAQMPYSSSGANMSSGIRLGQTPERQQAYFAMQAPSRQPLHLPGVRTETVAGSSSHIEADYARTRLRSNSVWDGNQIVADDSGFESWSPENSPRHARRSYGNVKQAGWQHPQSKNEERRWR